MGQIPLIGWALAALALYLLPKRQPPGRGLISEGGMGGNKAFTDSAELRSVDTGQLELSLNAFKGQAEVLQKKIKEAPALGTFLGLSATDVDYLVLPPEKFQSIYGFAQSPGNLTTPGTSGAP